MTRRTWLGLARHAPLLVWTAITLAPIYWMVMTSFKHSGEWVTWPPRWVPHEPTLINYVKVLTPGTSTFELGRQTLKILKPLWDSLFIATTASLVAVVLGSALAYSWTRFGTGGRRYPYNILSIRMVPPIVIAVPFVVYYVTLRLLDTYTCLILVYLATSLPYVIWMMLAFIEEVMAYPDVPASFRKLRFEDRPPPVLTLDYIVGGRSLSVFTTIATLGTPQDVTLQGVRVECFFPADDRSDALFRSLAAKR